MRHTRRYTVVIATLLLAACSTENESLGGKYPVDPGPDSGAGSGGTAGNGGTDGSGGTGGGTQGGGGDSGTGPAPLADLHTAFVDYLVIRSDLCFPRPLRVQADGQTACAVVQSTP